MPINRFSMMICVLGLCLPRTALAQDFSVPVMVTPWDLGTSSTATIDNVISQQLQTDIVDNSSRTASPERAPLSGVKSSDFAYRYSAARTQQNLRAFLARTPDPAGRAGLEQMYAAQPTIIVDVGNALRSYGLDPHNAADAYAAWWINAWSASQKTDLEPDRATVEAVKRQVYAAFAATPAVAKADDAARQEYAEGLILQAFLLSAAFEQNKGDPARLDQLAAAALQGAEASEIDLTTIMLTPNGFVPRP